MDVDFDFSDVDSFFDEGEWEVEKKMIDVGDEAVKYAEEHGDYQDHTLTLRTSNDYDVDKDGLTLKNEAEYASFVESKGYDVLSSAALYAEKRLKEEFEAHKKLIIAYDLDSTVFDYHNTGASYEMVKDLIRKYREYAYFIVFTSSEPDRYNEIESILQKENLPYDSINDDAPFIPFKGRKVYYNILLDDRAGLNQTYNELLKLYNLDMNLKPLNR